MNFSCSSLDTLTNSLALSVYFERIFTYPTSHSQNMFYLAKHIFKKRPKSEKKNYTLWSCELNYYWFIFHTRVFFIKWGVQCIIFENNLSHTEYISIPCEQFSEAVILEYRTSILAHCGEKKGWTGGFKWGTNCWRIKNTFDSIICTGKKNKRYKKGWASWN